MLQAPKQMLAPGDRAPNFVLPDPEGAFTMFYERVTGRPAVLVFAEAAEACPAFASVQAAKADLEAAGADVFWILQTPPKAAGDLVDARVWIDPKKQIAKAFLEQTGLGGLRALAGGKAVALLLDANQRLLAVENAAGAGLAASIQAFYGGRDRPTGEVRRANAPVLVMPDLLSPEMCRDLIEMFKRGDAQEGSVTSVVGKEQVSRIHHGRKKRLDFAIADRETNRILQQTIGRRIAPELEKAFYFSKFRFDRFLLCSYDAAREDRFRTHRDNLSPETGDRRFAMTLNLNGDQYEGGELTFPEYGPDLYKPGDGGAVIFSCSLLHEALPVTEGTRYALLTFLRA